MPLVSNLVDLTYWKVEERFRIPKPPINPRQGMSELAYDTAFHYLASHKPVFHNTRFMTIIDYTKPSYMKRMYIVDMATGAVESHLVAHGKNSGLVFATDFSNAVDSLKSCKGFFLTGEEYEGSHGKSLVLYGLEKGINDNAQKRKIVMHGAAYVSLDAIRCNGGRLGLSWGCPAVSLKNVDSIIERIKDGSLLYIYAN